MYNTLPTLGDAEERFTDREQLFAACRSLLAQYGNVFGLLPCPRTLQIDRRRDDAREGETSRSRKKASELTESLLPGALAVIWKAVRVHDRSHGPRRQRPSSTPPSISSRLRSEFLVCTTSTRKKNQNKTGQDDRAYGGAQEHPYVLTRMRIGRM